MAKDPRNEDVSSARSFLSDYRTRSAALRIIASKGTEMDVNGLIDIAISSYGDDRKQALEGVKRLTHDKLGTARILVASEVREIRRAGFSLIGALGEQEALPLLEELLSHDDQDLRIAAPGQICKRVKNEQLEDLLRRYINLAYFYNVVTWLDRLIYAPAPIANYYKTEFDRTLEALDQDRWPSTEGGPPYP